MIISVAPSGASPAYDIPGVAIAALGSLQEYHKPARNQKNHKYS
jgi:hypothetical protein